MTPRNPPQRSALVLPIFALLNGTAVADRASSLSEVLPHTHVPLLSESRRKSADRTGVLLEQAASNTEPTSESSRSDCALPSGARWCQVSASGGEPFDMAVYANSDIVSQSICNNGHWESLDLNELGEPGHALDIGGNIGYYTFVLANAGWKVTSFEPIDNNVDLMKATMCANPELNARITLNHVGLGAQATSCEIWSGNNNVGDGISRCGEDLKKDPPADSSLRGKFEVHKLDDLLESQGVHKVDFVKIDVEGFECQVFQGGPQVLSTLKPKHILSEVWGDMQGCKSQDYLDMFKGHGYQLAQDIACKNADDRAPPGREPNGHMPMKNFWMCNGRGTGSLLELPARRVLFSRT